MSDARVSQLSYSRIYLFWKHQKKNTVWLISSQRHRTTIFICAIEHGCVVVVECVAKCLSLFLFLMQNELKTISVNQWIKWINRKTQCRGAEDLSDFQLDVHKKCSRALARARQRNEQTFFFLSFIYLAGCRCRDAQSYIYPDFIDAGDYHIPKLYLSHFEWITNDEYTEQRESDRESKIGSAISCQWNTKNQKIHAAKTFIKNHESHGDGGISFWLNCISTHLQLHGTTTIRSQWNSEIALFTPTRVALVSLPRLDFV